MNPLILIPARMSATRLPGKPLADIHGEPMIVHVWRRAIASGARVVSTTTAEGEVSSATVLLALPNEHANDVAAASLNQPLTVVIVGDRAQPQTPVDADSAT